MRHAEATGEGQHVDMALFDVVRLDHFRGFAAYWEVGADEETAINPRAASARLRAVARIQEVAA